MGWLNHTDRLDPHLGVIGPFGRQPGDPVFGREHFKDGDGRIGEHLLDRAAAIKDDDNGNAVASGADLHPELSADTNVPLRRVLQEPALYSLLPGGVVKLSHGTLLDLSVDVVRGGLVEVGGEILCNGDERVVAMNAPLRSAYTVPQNAGLLLIAQVTKKLYVSDAMVLC